MSTPPLILFEDDHLLVINKPPGINTHSASAHSSEGIYDWLRNRIRKWHSLAIHQRLDRETSGVLLFGKSREANPSLARQFEERKVEKRYRLLTDRSPGILPRVVESRIAKAGGGRFKSTDSNHAKPARTEFRLIEKQNDRWLIEAIPLTGRTHQIRIHASDAGFPILGDELYGGSHFDRLCLHANSLKLKHPVAGESLEFFASIDFGKPAAIWLRAALWPGDKTNAWRIMHGASDGHPGWYVDRLGDFLLSQSEHAPTSEQIQVLKQISASLKTAGVYHKILDRKVRQSDPDKASPQHLFGRTAPDRFEIRENGIRYWMSFEEGYSVGLFLDQKENRNRLLTAYFFPGHLPSIQSGGEAESTCGSVPNFELDSSSQPVDPCGRADSRPDEAPRPLAGKTVLNTFAYTCGFSVCAAKAGANVTSLDLSKKYLDWGRDNFRLNDINPGDHDFIFGDCFDWMKRLVKKGRRFDLVLLDPPTFSKSKKSGVFKADKDYGRLVSDALNLLTPNGILFASTNCATLSPDEFLATIRKAVRESDRKIASEFYASQPPDFPTGSTEPPYLKTVWLRVMA